jgi:hypothetical protein
MNYNVMNKEPKEVSRNKERKEGIMKIVDSFTGMLERASEISHNAAKNKMANFTTWVRGTADGVTDLVISEDNYCSYDRQEKEMKELEEKKKED